MIIETIISIAIRLYRLLLRLYPAEFRSKFSEEMTAVFYESVQTAADAGWRDLLVALGNELRDLPVSCLRQHLWERNRVLLPESAKLSGWGALAAALPFLLFSFTSFSPPISRELQLVVISVAVIAAWWQHWPGWVVSWLGFLILVGQNWLPYSLLGEGPAWNTVPRLLNMLSAVVVQTGWLAVMYWVVRRWPRYGVLVFLPSLWMPWAFSMEFASDAMTAVVYNTAFLVSALIAVIISVQRSTQGDVWLLYGGALLPGAMLTLGAVLFTPGMQNAWVDFGTHLMLALAPFVGILLLQSLNAWGREHAVQRFTRRMTAGAVLAFMALLAFGRLFGPSDLESFKISLSPVLAAVWLLGVLLVLSGGWRLRSHFELPGKRYLAVATVMLVLLPLVYQPYFLGSILYSLVYDRPNLLTFRDALPAMQTVDLVLLYIGLGGLLLLPMTIAWLRRLRLRPLDCPARPGQAGSQTAAFPTSTEQAGLKAWWQRRRERRETRDRSGAAWLSTKRLALLLTVTVLLAGGIFFVAVFLPLQLEAEPYTRQVALGDLDGDGDLDAVLANTMRLLPGADNEILYNDGGGRFSVSNQNVREGGTGIALLDSDGDGDLDIVIGGMVGGIEFRNENDRFFPADITISYAPESGASQFYFHTGDVNGDGISDVFMVGCCGMGISRAPEEMEWVAPVNRVLLGSDAGLVDSGQALGVRGSQAVALGDLDGDGDLDAFVGNTQSNEEDFRNDEPNEVWLNDGDGNFSDSGQLLGAQRTYSVALGDVDADGDLDALVGNEGADELWLNDGDGRFTLSQQSWSGRETLSVFLVDLDGDGDLDALTGHQVAGSFAWWRQGLIWWNDGSGGFTRDDQRTGTGIRFRPNAALAVGDVNGDGWPDIVSGALDEVTVWLNDGDGRFSAADW